jgi:hypothetical protein
LAADKCNSVCHKFNPSPTNAIKLSTARLHWHLSLRSWYSDYMAVTTQVHLSRYCLTSIHDNHQCAEFGCHLNQCLKAMLSRLLSTPVHPDRQVCRSWPTLYGLSGGATTLVSYGSTEGNGDLIWGDSHQWNPSYDELDWLWREQWLQWLEHFHWSRFTWGRTCWSCWIVVEVQYNVHMWLSYVSPINSLNFVTL